MIFRDETVTEEIEAKAQILINALPYIRDFNQKIIVICFEGNNVLIDSQVKEVMRDVALLKTIGMRPIIVHDSKMGHDKFRENKLVAKMIELSGVKAVGICGIDLETIMLNVDNNYIPVITPNDIDNEDYPIAPADSARQVAKVVGAEKLIYLSNHSGVYNDENGNKIGQMKCSDFKKIIEAREQELDKKSMDREQYAIDAIESGVPRVHFIDVTIEHGILLELFSIRGVGTAILDNTGYHYPHELKNGELITE